VQGFVVNSHTSPFDVSVFGFDPVPLAATATTGTEDTPDFQSSGLIAYPNPFNPRTQLAFTLEQSEPVSLRVYDAAGRLVRTLLNESRAAGEQSVSWDGTDEDGIGVGAGVYHVQLAARSGKLLTKLVLVP
jgi:hypothetical protein